MPDERQKSLVVHRVPLVSFGSSTSCPTLLYFENESEPLIGEEALEKAEKESRIPHINHDFKVALGCKGATGISSQMFPCADGQERPAGALAAEFITQCLRKASSALREAAVHDSAHIIVAEPVSVHSEEFADWLPNYRKSLRDLLENRKIVGIDNLYFGEIEFLPEPLAVFNYYRYGFRHPKLSEKAKYCVLVLDVGGGTSDCSVVETTKDGEISRSGKNARPFGSSSEAVGGHSINHYLAADAIVGLVHSPDEKRKRLSSLKKCLGVTTGRRSYRDLSGEDAAFYDVYQWVLHSVEKAKKRLSAAIASDPRGWVREEPPAAEEWIKLPSNPYSASPIWKDAALSTTRFRDVFKKEIWDAHLKPLVIRTLENAAPALEGKKINRVILSGGTANIGWIGAWIQKDIAALHSAEFVDLKEDYQEIVAKGLAIECARRFFSDTHTSDFEMVTYNPLSLALGAGSHDPKPMALKPASGSALPDLHDKPGAMIESATDMRGYAGEALQWKVVSAMPKPKHLEYYFHAAPPDELFDFPDRIESRLNFDQWTLDVPGDAKFDKHFKVELEIRPDGTVVPTFVLREGKHATMRDRIKGRPFFLDMTSSRTEKQTSTKAYLGFDFGSSNTALAFVSAASVTQTQKDAEDPTWLDLSDLLNRLPSPMASILGLYMEESGDALKRSRRARQFIESALSLLLGAVMADEEKRACKTSHGANHGPLSAFKSSKVSAGPLWNALRTYIDTIRDNGSFTRVLADLRKGPLLESINQAVTRIGEVKHDKVDESAIEWNKPILQLGNLARQVFDKAWFGYFQDGRQRAGRAHVTFRRLTGHGVGAAPTSVVLEKMPEDGQPYLLIPSEKITVPLFPWILMLDSQDSQRRKFLFFDGPEGRQSATFSYRCPGEPQTVSISPEGSGMLDPYFPMVSDMLAGRFLAERINILELPQHEDS